MNLIYRLYFVSLNITIVIIFQIVAFIAWTIVQVAFQWILITDRDYFDYERFITEIYNF